MYIISKLMLRTLLRYIIPFSLLILFSGGELFLSAQVRPPIKRSASAVDSMSYRNARSRRIMLDDSTSVAERDSIPEKDSIAMRENPAIARDSLSVADSLARPDSLKRDGMLDVPVFSEAKDSVIEDFTGGKKMIYYYGAVKVKYGNMSISSDYMAYDVDAQTVYASGTKDTSGVLSGTPEMTEGGKSYTMEDVYYNFKSRKAKIKNMMTQEEEGYLHGEKLKMMADKSINISGGKYTVCELDHPHYYLKMTAAKVVTEPSQRTVFGPAYVVVEDVPLPVMLPFGFVPPQPKRASGILFPTFGEETSRGFYLRDLGYYMVFGDHFDIALTTSIYTLGSWNVNLNSRYKLRYKFDGNIGITYSVDQTGEKGSNDFFQSKNFAVKWSHSQDSKAHPGTSFRASVNFSSPSNSKYNSQSVQQALENQVSSSISYSKTWQNMSLSINGLHSQNSRDSSYAITLPNVTFNVNRFFPFKRKVRVGKERFYEQISFSYGTTLQNKINFKASEIKNPDFWDKMKTGMNHKFAIGLPSFTILKYLNFSPSVSYGMNWYFQESSRLYNAETDKVETVTTPQFSTFGISQDFSAGISMSTRIYGTYVFTGKNSPLVAMRHMITPSVSFSYKPEMGTRMNGYMTYNYVDKNGIEKSVDYNKYAGGLYSPPGKGKTAGISFSFDNNLEAKVRDKNDTTGTGVKKVKLIDNLRIGGSYNFLADSIKLSNISISANTTILQKVGISGNMTLDPYAVDDHGKKYNQFNISKMGGINLFRLTNASASLSWSISGQGQMKGNDGMDSGGGNSGGGGGKMQGGGGGGGVKNTTAQSYYNKVYYHPITGEYIPGGWAYYLNPTVPWSLSFNYSYSYSKSYSYANEQLQIKNNHTQTLSFSAQVRLTKDLNFNLNSGVDLTKLRLTTTQLSATYDLHCFQISVSWIPSGQWESWSFRINAKASALADLLQYKKSSSYWDN